MLECADWIFDWHENWGNFQTDVPMPEEADGLEDWGVVKDQESGGWLEVGAVDQDLGNGANIF